MRAALRDLSRGPPLPEVGLTEGVGSEVIRPMAAPVLGGLLIAAEIL